MRHVIIAGLPFLVNDHRHTGCVTIILRYKKLHCCYNIVYSSRNCDKYSSKQEGRRVKRLAYKQGNRHQMDLFPKSIEEYVQEDDPERIYDAFVESLSMEEI